ncbi:virulence activator alpha [Paenibacillus methanolicus]|uniref:Virulence activator alpha n=1 Tax=Paenibacillus methanolicus TaxID=582686 RepID=A0A5S5BP61_9BACL|nr:virulence activator alpha [Paenibacillus methanolicus]
MLEYAILGLLMEGKLSGYDIKKTMDSSVGLFYRASYGSLYPALKRMAERGWLSVEELASSKNKKLYAMLPEGEAAFKAWLAEPLQMSRSELLIKIFFYDYLDEETRQSNLAEYQQKLAVERGRLAAVEGIVSKELAALPNPRDYYYRVSVLSYGIDYFEMEQQWIRSIKEGMNRHDKSTNA